METIVITLIILMLLLGFGIGANDETMATVVASKALSLKKAVIIGSILCFLGVVFLSAGVGKTVGGSLLGEKVEYNNYLISSEQISYEQKHLLR